MQFWQHLVLGVALATVTLPANAISVAADNWTHTLADNITNAGDYYTGSFTTATSINIGGTTSSSQMWTLSARLTTDIAGLNIGIKRTGNGSGDSIPSGGTDDYQTLTTAFLPFFTGSGNVTGIPLELQISDVDVTDGNGTKTIPIEYQITTTN
jgi:hypothetical protein